MTSAQNDMQKQLAFLLKEKSLSHVELFVKDPENITTQFMMLTEILDQGDVATAFEKVSNLNYHQAYMIKIVDCKKSKMILLFSNNGPFFNYVVLYFKNYPKNRLKLIFL